MQDAEVLIAGAGPTGLTLAIWLAKQGVRVRIVDRLAQPGTTSRALAVQARTLELYRQIELTDAVIAGGHQTPAVNLWVKGAEAARIPFDHVGAGLTPYPFLHIFPQDKHERLLIERLQQLGVWVERPVELIDFEERDGAVIARLQRPGGEIETCNARYLAGCDGARSRVREKLGIGFPGGTYKQIFYVADVEGTGPAFNGELHIDLDKSDFLGIFPIEAQGRARLIGTVRDQSAAKGDALTFDDVSDHAIASMKVKVSKINWFSTYHVHHRVVDSFGHGRAFLLGDAAHIHSPAGGQGMNTGIGDSINLAWKLAAVLRGAPDSLLDSFEAERIGFARRLVATTDRAFSFATAEGPIAEILRTRIAPLLIPVVTSFQATREFMFRTVSQVMINYRDSALSAGAAGKVHGGDRLPWAATNDADNYAPLSAIRWQAHVYGAARPELTAWCAANDMPLHVFGWNNAFEEAGFARNAVYVTRPDSYVGLAEPSGAADAVEKYLRESGVSPGLPH